MGRRGPKPTPTAMLRLTGSRELESRHAEPKPALGAPTPPKWLNREARAEWRRVCPELVALGVLALIDRAVLVGYVEAWSSYVGAVAAAKVRGSTDGGRRTAEALELRDSRAAYLRFAQDLGLSPSARVRMTSKAAVDADPLGSFARSKLA